jgi:hypothetical protein
MNSGPIPKKFKLKEIIPITRDRKGQKQMKKDRLMASGPPF